MRIFFICLFFGLLALFIYSLAQQEVNDAEIRHTRLKKMQLENRWEDMINLKNERMCE